MGHRESVDLTWSPRSRTADEAVLDRLTALLGPGAVRVGRLCPRCGSSGHGRPWARHGDRGVAVSIARAGDHLLTAISLNVTAIGVDVEDMGAVAAHSPGEVLGHGETVSSAEELAQLWAQKEAILKANGVGLSRPMAGLRVADYAGRLEGIVAPVGFVAWVALGGELGQ